MKEMIKWGALISLFGIVHLALNKITKNNGYEQACRPFDADSYANPEY